MSPSDERLWATLAHVGVLITGIVGPLVIYLVFRERSAWLKASAEEALNFSILFTLVMLGGVVSSFALIGFLLMPAAFIAALVLCIQAAVAANRGESYRYPVNWRVVR